ncbi:aminobenzoyl-glutamate utilization protein A [Tindallia magadiensis]|uniref:Aminobenzoyl-glutamate utilization protein A n=1 Tax=Tindallia magadiensis TaxID=69895 RepID=A0A1I3E0X4_9FIRM|nr:amidohydrolase [Tindallia magadiensis]SFH92509.1 aminobenzoyl-glutamate utilization protein A [Tindallia magadiensis]
MKNSEKEGFDKGSQSSGEYDAFLEEKIIAYRREFHRYAESGWREFRTTARIVEVLESLGYHVLSGKEVIHPPSVMGRDSEEVIAQHIKRAIEQGGSSSIINKMGRYTGAVGILETGRPGPTIALRFDIDANDVLESNEENHRPQVEGFRSLNEGMMHACGHDGHTAIGLGLAEYLMDNKKELKGKIKFIFQPAEEGVRGAKAMIDKGILADVDFFLSGHIGFQLPNGKFAPKTKGFLSTTKIDVEFTGEGAHAGSDPEKGKNALLAAVTATSNIHSIPPHSEGVTRVNVGVLKAGVARNVIPPKAVMEIETRGETEALNALMYEKTIKIIEHAAAMHNNYYQISKMGEAGTVSCDHELAEIVGNTVKDLGIMDEVVDIQYLGGSEDATLMIKEVQNRGGMATYMIFGSAIGAGHHHEAFDFDECVLIKGLKIYAEVIKKIPTLRNDV